SQPDGVFCWVGDIWWLCRMIGARLVWAISNFIVFACMLATTILSWISHDLYSSKLQHIVGADKSVKTSTLILFSFLGLPLSITYSVPFSLYAELTAGTGGGQGLATGVLNLTIVAPQLVVSLEASPWDKLLGEGTSRPSPWPRSSRWQPEYLR
uniref:Uncharacterized protein n=1 Tax=Aegilops tauschii subsp. strangulata TaxID=200361 RepID=A0A453H1V1_AEGTS